MKKITVRLTDAEYAALRSQATPRPASTLAAQYVRDGIAANTVAPPTAEQRYLAVWTGTTLDPSDTSVPYLKQKILDVCPWPSDETTLEWYVKAGEGGTWQRTWDDHPLAPSSGDNLAQLHQNAQHFNLGVVPYVVVRGRPEWQAAEQQQIRECVQATGHCILNLESGGAYWNGPTDPGGVQAWFDQLGVDPARLWLTTIPRYWVLEELGGVETLKVWMRNCAGTSWECYGAIAPDLKADVAIPRMQQLFGEFGPWYFIAAVNRSEIATWAGTPYATPALQAWQLYGD